METDIQTIKQLHPFTRFAKTDKENNSLHRASKTVVVYTRVSSREQTNNMSLPYQRQVIDEYAIREGLTIAAYFGGKFESAKSDGRKEFQRMLDYIKKSKGTISQILVYTVDRFSRTGGGAIKLAQDLRDQYGVAINAISQPTDVNNPTGVFQQNIQFLFSNYDNVLRKQRVIAGMRYKLEQGNWIVRPPMGYDIIRINGDRRLEINENGRKIKKAFQWKAEGFKSEDILQRIHALGVKMSRQKISEIFKNPFYCGIIAHNMLGGRVVDGIHEPLISRELFLKVNNIQLNAGQLGVPHIKENNNLPLKVFLKCDKCRKPLTGYMVQKKNLYYYKCRTIGCNCNIRNLQIHKAFRELLSVYTVKPELQEPLKYELADTFSKMTKEQVESEQILKSRLIEVNKKIDAIEEKYFALNEMSAETFEKFNTRFNQEKSLIVSELERNTVGSSNLEIGIKFTLEMCSKLSSLWDSATVPIKERLQKLLFPDGIYYNRENNTVRTEKVNLIFLLIAHIIVVLDKKETRQNTNFLDLSGLVQANLQSSNLITKDLEEIVEFHSIL